MVEIDGNKYVQSFSIMRLLGRKFGYYPSDIEQAYKVDSYIDGLNDLLNLLGRAMNEQDEEKRSAAFKQVFSADMPKFLTVMENRLKANSSQLHLVGDDFTTADFHYAAILCSLFYNEHNPFSAQALPILENFPAVKAYSENLRDVVLKDYLAQRPARFI